MIINWNQNPFKTKVEIDDRDKHMILLAHQNEEYTNILVSLDFGITGKYKSQKFETIDEVAKEIKEWEYICNLTAESEDIQAYFDYLDTEHMGDCTCVPCSCIRCQVEYMLGINTIAGLGKHSAGKVYGAFGKNGDKTLDEVIAILEADKEYIKPDTWPDKVGWDVHIPRWESERKSAVEWLKKYKEEHNF